jgi:hypothetical protein
VQEDIHGIPCESIVLVQGNRIDEEPLSERVHDLQSGTGMSSTSWLDSGMSLPRRIWPHHAVRAGDGVHVWRGELPCQSVTNLRVMLA